MEWYCLCPLCETLIYVTWEEKGEEHICPFCEESHFPPSPAQNHEAFVNTRKWPEEMEKVVIRVKGKYCTIPWCKKNYETLDHRVAYRKGGRTSVNNLFPMCNEHNQSKGDLNYDIWLRKQLAKILFRVTKGRGQSFMCAEKVP